MGERDRPVSSAEGDPPLSEEEREARLRETEAELAKIQSELDAELKREPRPKLDWRQRSTQLSFLVLLGFFLLWLGGALFGPELNDWLSHVNPVPPNAEPPFYYIQRDFIDGVAMLVPFVLALIVAGVYFRRAPYVAPFAAWQSVVLMAPSIAVSVIIWFKTTDLFTPAATAPDWPTREAYRHDPVFFYTHAGIYAGVILMAVAMVVIQKSWRLKELSRREEPGFSPPGP